MTTRVIHSATIISQDDLRAWIIGIASIAEELSNVFNILVASVPTSYQDCSSKIPSELYECLELAEEPVVFNCPPKAPETRSKLLSPKQTQPYQKYVQFIFGAGVVDADQERLLTH